VLPASLLATLTGLVLALLLTGLLPATLLLAGLLTGLVALPLLALALIGLLVLILRHSGYLQRCWLC
jgi:hypothetical protein